MQGGTQIILIIILIIQMITINMSAEDDTRVPFILCLAAKWGGFSQEDFS